MAHRFVKSSEQKQNYFCIVLGAIFLVSLPYSMDFAIAESLKVGLFLWLNVLCGSFIYVLLSKRHNFHFAELAGLGFAIGTALPGLVNLFFRFIGISDPLTGIAFPSVVVIAAFICNKTGRLRKIVVKSLPTGDLILIQFSSLLAIFAWSKSLWISTILIGSTIAINFIFDRNNRSLMRQQKLRTVLKSIQLLVFPISSVLNSYFLGYQNSKPIWRGQIGVDTAFDDAQAFGVARYGFGDNIFQAGNPTRGHVLTHAWAGDVAELLNLPRFLVTGTFGFAVGIMAITFIVYAVAIREFNSLDIGRFAVFIIFIQSSLPEPYFAVLSPRMANSLSMLWFFAFWYMFIEYRERKITFQLFITTVGIFTLTVAKFHWGLISCGTLAIFALFDLYKFKSYRSLLLPVFASFAFLVSYIYLLKGMDAYDTALFGVQLGLAPLVLSLFVLRVHPFLSIFQRIGLSDYSLICLIQLGFAFPLLWLTNGANQTSYFVSTTLILFSILIAAVFSGKRSELQNTHQIRFFLALGISLGLVTSVFYFFANYRLVANNHYTFIRFFVVDYAEIFQLAIIFVVLALYRCVLSISWPYKMWMALKPKLPISLVATTLILGSNLGTWAVVSYRPVVLSVWFDLPDQPEYVFNDDQFEVANWIATHTSSNAIIASNTLCLKIISEGERTPSTNIGPDCKNRNMLAWLSSLSHRRMFLEAPLTSLMGSGSDLSEFEINSYNAVIRFGLNGDQSSLEFLQELGVTYFVIEHGQSGGIPYVENLDLVFNNSRYSIVKFVSV